VLFFDLEFYVPPSERNNTFGSLVFNPANPSHQILGGYFIGKDLDSPNLRRQTALWRWNFHNNEEALLSAIYDLFIEEWDTVKSKRPKTVHHKVVDLITCGFAISRMDLPALFIRSQRYHLKADARLVEVFLKTKSIDLSDVASFLFPEDVHLYPKTANEVGTRLQIGSEGKTGGKAVWDWYDQGKFNKIEQRCKEEVHESVRIYQQLQNRIHGL
jgi:hypothetical protein